MRPGARKIRQSITGSFRKFPFEIFDIHQKIIDFQENEFRLAPEGVRQRIRA